MRRLAVTAAVRAFARLPRSSAGAVQPAWAAVSVLPSRDGIRTRAFAAQAAPLPVPQSKMADSHLNGASTAYLEELEARFRENPASVDKSWANFFALVGECTRLGQYRAARWLQVITSTTERELSPATQTPARRRKLSPRHTVRFQRGRCPPWRRLRQSLASNSSHRKPFRRACASCCSSAPTRRARTHTCASAVPDVAFVRCLQGASGRSCLTNPVGPLVPRLR